jgi:zinc transport system substrate-binding protein
VEVTNYPLAYVVERLGGALLQVRFRAAEAADPAYWRPTAEEVVGMQEADLIFVNGAGYEPWLKDVSLPTSRLVDTTAGVRERLIAIETAVTHSHGTEGEHEHTGTAFTTWLDPTLFTEQARAVGAALERTWPEQAGLFADRLTALVSDLEKLDAEQEAATAGADERPVVFSHPVYQYLAKRYALAGDSVHWEPDQAPDSRQWAELEHLRDHTKPEWMIWEAPSLAETITRLEEAGMRSVVVDPCATPPAEGDLLDAMRRNAEALGMVYATAD